MQVYDHPTFRMAGRQFDIVTDRLQIPDNEREPQIKIPMRLAAWSAGIRRVVDAKGQRGLFP